MMFSVSLQAVDHAEIKYDLSARFVENGATLCWLDAEGVDSGSTVKDRCKALEMHRDWGKTEGCDSAVAEGGCDKLAALCTLMRDWSINADTRVQ